MTTRREAAAVRWADLLLADNAAVDDWNATGRMYQEVRDAEAAYRAVLADPAPALDPLTALTVAKLRAAADALERGEVPAGVAFAAQTIDDSVVEEYDAAHAKNARNDAESEIDQSFWDEEGWLAPQDEVEVIGWRVIVTVESARVVRRRCQRINGEPGDSYEMALVDPDAWTEPALDVCDVVGCEHCGGPGGGA